MKILLTGASGFIGLAVLQQLIEESHHVTLISRPGKNTAFRHLLKSLGFQGELLEAESRDWVSTVGDRAFDTCLHLAWIATPGTYLNSPENQILADNTCALATKLFANGTTHFIGTGSCIEYSPGQTTRCHELSTPTNPISLYGIAKNRTRIELTRIATETRKGWTWVRVFYPYGLGEHPSRTATTFLRTLANGQPLNLRTGASVKDFIEIGDVASALVHLLDCPPQGIINLGTGIPTSIRELAILAAEVTATNPALVSDSGDGIDPYAFHLADITKLIATGWSPSHSLKYGINRLFKANGNFPHAS